MDYKQTLDYLFSSLPDYQDKGSDAYKPGLQRVQQFAAYLGRPDRYFLSVHVAGTNGKGSVSHILASVLHAAGYRVGLYTSPHLKDFRERIRVDGEMIPQNKVVGFVRKHKAKMEELGLSFFEMTVGMALDHFYNEGVEVAIIETGLGGRLDATNIITSILSVITNIGLDHTSLLGDTPEKIAAEKAGIIKRGVPVVIGQSDEATDHVFVKKAVQMKADIRFAEEMFHARDVRREEMSQRMVLERMCDGMAFDICLDLLGDYQKHNAVTAFAALEILRTNSPLSFSRRAVAEGCGAAAASTSLMGRWQVLAWEPLTVCDTGHNAHGLSEVIAQIRKQKYEKLYIVLGFVEDKDLSAILPLFPQDAYYIFTSFPSHRALPAEKLTETAAGYGLHGETVPKVTDAYDLARRLATPRDMIFIGGSTFTVAEIF